MRFHQSFRLMPSVFAIRPTPCSAAIRANTAFSPLVSAARLCGRISRRANFSRAKGSYRGLTLNFPGSHRLNCARSFSLGAVFHPVTGRAGVQDALAHKSVRIAVTQAEYECAEIPPPVVPSTRYRHGLPGTVQSAEHRADVFRSSFARVYRNRVRRRKLHIACRARVSGAPPCSLTQVSPTTKTRHSAKTARPVALFFISRVQL